MMNIGLFYFSGTGTTKSVAEMFEQEFISYGHSVTLLAIEDIHRNDIAMEAYDIIGIGCQLLGWCIPRIVSAFIHGLKQASGDRIFTFLVAAGSDAVSVNLYAAHQLKRKLQRKGYDVFYQRYYAIRSNWIVRFSDSSVKQLYDATKKKIHTSVDEILGGKKRAVKTGAMLKLFFPFVTAWARFVFRFSAKDIRMSDKCTDCGICVKRCPTNNLTIKGGKMHAGFSCMCCMRCIYICPQRALTYRFLKFFIIDGDYQVNCVPHCQESMNDNGVKPKYIDAYTSVVDQ